MNAETEQPMRLRLAAPDVGEEELDAIRRVFASGVLTNGPETASFEAGFAAHHGAEHGIAFSSGTVALTALLLAHGIGPGDEVIVPSFTFISTATSVLHAGARPVFADIEASTFCLDPADAGRRITAATRAIIPVHYGGQPADLAPLRELADDAGVTLLEDAAEAHGATYRGQPVGAIGHAGMFSFTPTKNITTGEGGLVVTSDPELAQKLRLLRNHGHTPMEGRHRQHTTLGFNWRLTEMQAAMGRVQLGKLAGVLERKRAAAAHLSRRLDAIDGISPPVVAEDRDHVFMLYTTTIDHDERDLVLKALNAQGIEARLYFPPAHHQPVFGDGQPELPVTDWAADHALSLPLHTRLRLEDLDDIARAVADALDGSSAKMR